MAQYMCAGANCNRKSEGMQFRVVSAETQTISFRVQIEHPNGGMWQV